MFDAKALAMGDSTHALAAILGGAIVEGDGQGDFVLVFIQHRGGVHASGDDDYCVLHFSCQLFSYSVVQWSLRVIARNEAIQSKSFLSRLPRSARNDKEVVVLPCPDAPHHRSWRRA